MDNYRLKIKIGDHEFEAEGPSHIVQSQFSAFKDLIANLPSISTVQNPLVNTQNEADNSVGAGQSALTLERVARVEDRVVSLTARPEKIEDALLLLLLGQRIFRANDSVTGSEVIDGE